MAWLADASRHTCRKSHFKASRDGHVLSHERRCQARDQLVQTNCPVLVFERDPYPGEGDEPEGLA